MRIQNRQQIWDLSKKNEKKKPNRRANSDINQIKTSFKLNFKEKNVFIFFKLN